jgi:hypothetical protein
MSKQHFWLLHKGHASGVRQGSWGVNMVHKAIRRVFFCSFNAHARSRKHAKVGGSYTVSQCNYCGIPMAKRANGKWEVDNT